MNRNDDLKSAISLALSGDWDRSHRIVQEIGDSTASWIHAVLHKMEGDESNSRYWYAKTGARYDDYRSASEELRAILKLLE
ncbi:hypothetical protein GALL_349790 [mine drainage metagenome]|uniref:Uncharacterized protein n=1 Tax=mine drainage metagenome TaxID=410659 RepID=A0A1J5QIA6_9ZZZZ